MSQSEACNCMYPCERPWHLPLNFEVVSWVVSVADRYVVWNEYLDSQESTNTTMCVICFPSKLHILGMLLLTYMYTETGSK